MDLDDRGNAPAQSTLGQSILTLISLSGEIPPDLLGRLSVHDAYIEKVLKKLRAKNFIRTYYHDGLRGYRLTAEAKKYLLERWPNRFDPLFSGDSATNAPSYKITDRIRLHRMAEVLMTMKNAGVSFCPWEKPAVFRATPPDDVPYIECPAYYSSREIKQLGPAAVKVKSSRAAGLLLADNKLIAIYNTESGLMKWSNRAELRLIAFLEVELIQKRLSKQFGSAAQSAVVFGDAMSQLPALMGMGGNQPHQGLFQDTTYPHFHYLTNDHHGEVVLQLLCDPVERARLDELLGGGYSDARPDGAMENDAMDGDSPVLFGYTCDVPRITRFSSALAQQQRSGTLFCFDFQVKTMKKICHQCVSVRPMERQRRNLANMLGAEIDFVVKGIDSNARSIVASRKDAMLRKRQVFYMNTDELGAHMIYEGRIVQARVIAVAEKVVRVEAFGVECAIIARDLSWEWLGDAREHFSVGDRVLIRVLTIDRSGGAEDLSITADIRSVSSTTNLDNLKKCQVQCRYVGRVTDMRGGVVYIRLNNGVNAVAHACYDMRTPGKKDDVSFAVTRLDEEKGIAVGIITRIIKQNL